MQLDYMLDYSKMAVIASAQSRKKWALDSKRLRCKAIYMQVA